MGAGDVIREARAAGRDSLSEHESKLLLAEAGIPVVREVKARNVGEALEAARDTGFPVVLKGLGSRLLHKTERGLVHLNIRTKAQLERAARAIEREAAQDLEGFLVQPFLSGRREFVIGMNRDGVFGPVVMFGLGGVFTEALADFSLRLAPLEKRDALAMIGEIRAKRLLGPFRGEAAVDVGALADALVGLSRLVHEHPEIREVDVNPLLVTGGGFPVAVDALVVLGDGQEDARAAQPVEPRAIANLFYPKSIAFIGASARLGKWGHMLPCHTISGGFPGEIYLVNEKGGTIMGRPVFRDIADVPGKVDLAVVSIPARAVIDLLPKIRAKGIRNVLLISSGFAETGENGARLQEELVRKAREEGLVILGPNTMGIANPHINLYCTGSPVRPRAGSTAVVAQSGNMGVQLLGFAEEQGIGIRGFCGSGNEAMITVEDFIEGFARDDLTKIVMLYVEGVRDGRRFFESARTLSRIKPIVLLKGGQSEAGSRAASSHTGAMTSDARVFDAVCAQAGIVKVEQSMDLLDLAASFSSVPPPKGPRVAVMTLGGGWGVITADLCAQHGLEVSALSPELIERFNEILPPYWSHANPVDLVGEPDNSLMTRVMEELVAWDGCDALINLGIMGRSLYFMRMAEAIERADPAYDRDFLEKSVKYMHVFEQDYLKLIARLMDTYQKPIYGVSILTDAKSRTVYTVEGHTHKPVFYQSPERAVKACARMYEYHRFVSS